MSKIIEEQLSVWLDDELEQRQSDMLVRRLTSNPALRQTAARYCLIGDALRGELAAERALEVSERVSRSLDGDPGAAAAAPAAALAGWRRPLAGAAVAASVAVAAIVGLRSTGPDPQGELPVAAETSPVPAYTVPVDLSRRAGAPDRLSRYYLNHSQYATMLGGKGSLVRMISTPPDQSEAAETEAEGQVRERDDSSQ